MLEVCVLGIRFRMKGDAVKFQQISQNLALVFVTAAICAVTFWLVLHSREAESARSEFQFQSLVGRSAPSFKMTSIDGKTFDSGKLTRPLVLELFATWCDICQSEVPTLNRLTSDDQIEVVAVNGDRRGMTGRAESTEDLRRFKAKYGVNFPILFDRDVRLAKALSIPGVPTIIVIDQSGKITYSTAGMTSYDEIVAHLGVHS
jgi:thiol-disulfide isomerase/thioredoxin